NSVAEQCWTSLADLLVGHLVSSAHVANVNSVPTSKIIYPWSVCPETNTKYYK
ncbi:protein Tob1-like X1, partial [Biomphalaria glabrata]